MNISKRTIASRANGARSHGPKTESGKQRSSMNSTRHGLLARCVLLKNESPEPFEQLCREFIDKLQPADNVELACVEEMAAATWRLRRVMAIETNLMNREIEKCTGGDEFLCVAESFSRLSAGTELQLIDRYENRLHRLYQRSLNNLLTLQQLRADQAPEELAVSEDISPEPNEPEPAQPPAESAASAPPSEPSNAGEALPERPVNPSQPESLIEPRTSTPEEQDVHSYK